MTPKEKADELVKKFSEFVSTWDCYNDCPEDPKVIAKDAKKCALVAVDELINHCGQVEPFLGVDYWNDVKAELSNPTLTGTKKKKDADNSSISQIRGIVLKRK